MQTLKARKLASRGFSHRLKNREVAFFSKSRKGRLLPGYPGNTPYYVDGSGNPRRKVQGKKLMYFLTATAMWENPIFETPSNQKVLANAYIENECRGLSRQEMRQVVAYELDVQRDYKQCNMGWCYSGPDADQPSFYRVTITFYRRKR